MNAQQNRSSRSIVGMTPDLIDRAKLVLAMKQEPVARYGRDFAADPTDQGADLLRRANADFEQFLLREGAQH